MSDETQADKIRRLLAEQNKQAKNILARPPVSTPETPDPTPDPGPLERPKPVKP